MTVERNRYAELTQLMLGGVPATVRVPIIVSLDTIVLVAVMSDTLTQLLKQPLDAGTVPTDLVKETRYFIERLESLNQVFTDAANTVVNLYNTHTEKNNASRPN